MSEKLRPCPICGAMMKAYSARKTCSHKCRSKAYRLNRRRGILVSTNTLGTLCIRCVNCGDKIPNPRLDQKYCKPACKQAMYRQRLKWAQEPEEKYVQMTIPESAYTITNSV